MYKRIEALNKLKAGNKLYVEGKQSGKTDLETRVDTKYNGQHPYAVVVCCSDSRVPPEVIFSAGIGDLFVIRTAGNVLSGPDLGSIEYGIEHLGTTLIVVMGHTCCGAIGACLEGDGGMHIDDIMKHIHAAIGDERDYDKCTRMNVVYSAKRIRECHDLDKCTVVEAMYDIESGEVEFFGELIGTDDN